MDLNARVNVNCGQKDRRKTGCLYLTLLKQVRKKGLSSNGPNLSELILSILKNSIPYNATKLPKMTKFKKAVLLAPSKTHEHLRYVYKKYAWFQIDPLKIVREVDYTNSIPYNTKSCLK